ncbi:hypothetical protein JW960_00330 [candidate division KSB1 bacterium]|nr:hypothetical protein [candidate division KSB1 bacterium]
MIKIKVLTAIPDKIWEGIGTVIGFSASIFIAVQIITELKTAGPSTLSTYFVSGFFVIYFFWFLYGVRYQRFAIWFTNALAALLQLILLIILSIK